MIAAQANHVRLIDTHGHTHTNDPKYNGLHLSQITAVRCGYSRPPGTDDAQNQLSKKKHSKRSQENEPEKKLFFCVFGIRTWAEIDLLLCFTACKKRTHTHKQKYYRAILAICALAAHSNLATLRSHLKFFTRRFHCISSFRLAKNIRIYGCNKQNHHTPCVCVYVWP